MNYQISSVFKGGEMTRTVISKVELVGLNMIVLTIHSNLIQSFLDLKRTHREEVTFFFWAQITHVHGFFFTLAPVVFFGDLSLNEAWNDALNDPTSPVFQNLTSRLKEEVRET